MDANPTIYISDLDGTLLRNNATLSPFAANQLTRLIQAGTLFTVASARSLETISQTLQGVPLALPVICLNGGYLSDFKHKKHLVANSIHPDIVQKIQHLATHEGLGLFISAYQNDKEYLYYHSLNNEGQYWYKQDRENVNDYRLAPLNDYEVLVGKHIMCFTIIGQKEPLEALQETVHHLCGDTVATHLFENQYSKGWYWFTIHDCKANKANGIKALLEHTQLDNANLVVFGDQTNDIEMFQMADEAVAVANADQKLLPFASKTIGSNEEDAVVKYILKHEAVHRSQ